MLCQKNIGDISEYSHLLNQPGVDPNIRDQVRYEIHGQSSKLNTSLYRMVRLSSGMCVLMEELTLLKYSSPMGQMLTFLLK